MSEPVSEPSPEAVLLALSEAVRLSNDDEAQGDVFSMRSMGEALTLTETREWRPAEYDGHRAQVAMASEYCGWLSITLVRSTVPDEKTGEEPITKGVVFDYEEALWFARAILRLDRRVKDEATKGAADEED